MQKEKSYEPRVAVFHANDGRWKASNHNEAPFMNGVEAWVYALNGEFISYKLAKKEDVARYDIIIANMDFNGRNNWLPKLIEFGESRPASTQWVTLVEGSAIDYLKPLPSVVRACNLADLVNCINIYSLPFFRHLTSSRVEYIGIPYPVEGMRRYAIPIEKRRKAVFLCPFLLNRWNDYLVAKQLSLPFYGYERQLSGRLRALPDNVMRHRSLDPQKYFKQVRTLYNDDRLDVLPSTYLENFFLHNASAYLWLNLDDRYTWGRYVLDAAALGIPIITTRATGHGEKLFPHTTVADAFQIDEAIELGRRLIQDEDFYREVAEYPVGRMEHLKGDVMKERLLNALSS